jgi:hypothetical protein
VNLVGPRDAEGALLSLYLRAAITRPPLPDARRRLSAVPNPPPPCTPPHRSFILKSAEAATAEDWDAALGSNVKGYGLASKYAIKAMRKSPGVPKEEEEDGARARPGAVRCGAVRCGAGLKEGRFFLP